MGPRLEWRAGLPLGRRRTPLISCTTGAGPFAFRVWAHPTPIPRIPAAPHRLIMSSSPCAHRARAYLRHPRWPGSSQLRPAPEARTANRATPQNNPASVPAITTLAAFLKFGLSTAHSKPFSYNLRRRNRDGEGSVLSVAPTHK